MEFPNIDQLKFVFEKRQQYCVSLFMPTHRGAPDTRQDPIRLKTLTKEAESRLLALGRTPAQAKEMLKPLRELPAQDGFWTRQQDGLAVFLASDLFYFLPLPLQVPELISVSESFEVSPMMPLFTAGGHFYVLALSRNRVRLFRGTSKSFDEITNPAIPQSVDDALKYDVRESQLQVHSGAGGSAGGKEGSVFTGQGIGVDDEEDRTHEFLLMVDKGVRHALPYDHAPLVLAAVSELAAAYRHLNKYPVLLDQSVVGNPDRLKPHELHAATWDIARSYFERDQKQAMTRYQELAGSVRTSTNLQTILEAAHAGRIESVFLPAGTRKWGKFKSEENLLEQHPQQQPSDEDLLNLIAKQTILHRGTTYVIAPQDIPEHAELAAVFRY